MLFLLCTVSILPLTADPPENRVHVSLPLPLPWRWCWSFIWVWPSPWMRVLLGVTPSEASVAITMTSGLRLLYFCTTLRRTAPTWRSTIGSFASFRQAASATSAALCNDSNSLPLSVHRQRVVIRIRPCNPYSSPSSSSSSSSTSLSSSLSVVSSALMTSTLFEMPILSWVWLHIIPCKFYN